MREDHQVDPANRVARAGGQRVDQKLGIPTGDGEVLWVSYRSAPLPDGTITSKFTRSFNRAGTGAPFRTESNHS